MARVFIGIGSNIRPEKNIVAAVSALQKTFGRLDISGVYESKAVGFAGANFYNLVVGFDTGLAPGELTRALNDIEDALGRERGITRYSSRTLDLDLLLYEDLVIDGDGLKLPRGDIVKFAFVLCPLAEIAGDLPHPVSGQSFREIWRAFDKTGQELWPVELAFSDVF